VTIFKFFEKKKLKKKYFKKISWLDTCSVRTHGVNSNLTEMIKLNLFK